VGLTIETLAEYKERHKYIRRLYGSASEYACFAVLVDLPDCAERAEHWATLHGRPGQVFEDYVPLCRECHQRYDGVGFFKELPWQARQFDWLNEPRWKRTRRHG
jgi:hypothetical protein